MPIQWALNSYGDLGTTQTLANVIQGESASQAGQFAVASTMLNRLNNGGFGSSIEQVVTPKQFNGFQQSQPGSFSYQLAQGLQSGNLSAFGNTGNALYFAAPASSNTAWANPSTASGQGLFANGANIGGNFFTDAFGPPTSGFVPPSLGAAGNSNGLAGSGLPGTDPGTTGPFSGAQGTVDYAAEDKKAIAALNASGASPTPGVAVAPGGATSPTGAALSPSSTASTAGAASGMPVNITDATTAGSVAGKSVQSGLTSAGKNVQSGLSTVSKQVGTSTQQVDQTATSIFSGLEKSLLDIGIRGGLILIAAVLLIGAWIFFNADARSSVVNVVAKA